MESTYRLTLNEKKIDIAPITVLFQSETSSDVIKLAYFFENVENLISYELSRRNNSKYPKELIRRALYRLFDNDPTSVLGNVDIGWENGEKNFLIDLEKFTPNRPLTKAVEQIINSPLRDHSVLGHAFFVPSERGLYVYANKLSPWRLISPPPSLKRFADAIENVKEFVKSQPIKNPMSKKMHRLTKKLLEGEAQLSFSERWVWKNKDGKTIEIARAKPFQKDNFSWLVFAETIFEQVEKGLIEKPFRLYIEEPEIHFHPAKQAEMIKIIAYLANHGVNIMFSTNSTKVVEELKRLTTIDSNDEFYISPEKVAVYHVDSC